MGTQLHRSVQAIVIVAVLALSSAMGTKASAQVSSSNTDVSESNAAYYSFLRSGEVAIPLLVLGDVGAPGVYSVGVGTGIVDLLALSRGIPSGLGTSGRDAIVRLYRQASDRRVLAYEQPMELVLTGVPPPPTLQAQDILMVELKERARWLTVDNVLRTLTTAATLALLIDRIRN